MSRARLLLKGLALMASLLAIGWELKESGLAQSLDQQWVDGALRGQNDYGWLIFVAIGMIAVAVGLPRQLVCFLGGYGFGLGEGLVLAQTASMMGCLLCVLYARLMGRDLVRHRFPQRLKKLDDFLQDHPLVMTMLIRFLPVGSNLVTNLLAGVSSVRLLPFLGGSLIGYLPQTIIFVLLGSGVHVQPIWRSALAVILFLISALLGLYLYRRLRQGHSLDESLDQV